MKGLSTDHKRHVCMNCGHEEVSRASATVSCRECGEPTMRAETYIQTIQRETHEWRMEKWPDLSPMAQLAGTDVEVSELLEMEVKGEHYDEAWANEEQFKSEIGDVMIYLMGYASLRGFDIVECIDAAQGKNQSRDWEEHQKAPNNG